MVYPQGNQQITPRHFTNHAININNAKRLIEQMSQCLQINNSLPNKWFCKYTLIAARLQFSGQIHSLPHITLPTRDRQIERKALSIDCIVSIVDGWNTGTEQWLNDNDRVKTKYAEKILSQCESVHHKSHLNWNGIEREPPWWQAGN